MQVSYSSGVEGAIVSIMDHHLLNMGCCNSSMNTQKHAYSLKISSTHLQNISFSFHIYKGESKSKGKTHLTALIEVPVGNFTYHFST